MFHILSHIHNIRLAFCVNTQSVLGVIALTSSSAPVVWQQPSHDGYQFHGHVIITWSAIFEQANKSIRCICNHGEVIWPISISLQLSTPQVGHMTTARAALWRSTWVSSEVQPRSTGRSQPAGWGQGTLCDRRPVSSTADHHSPPGDQQWHY